MKIIGAGLPRTATLTQKIALEMLGFGPCYHMSLVVEDPGRIAAWAAALEGKRDWNAIFGGFESTVDYPGSFYYRELADAYPDAKVLLSTRDGHAWARSVRDTVWGVLYDRGSMAHHLAEARGQIHPVMRQFTQWQRKLFEKSGLLGSDPWTFDEDALAAGMERHNAQVRECIPAERLLEWSPKDGWEPLCAFLDVPVPAAPLPHVNDSAAFAEMIIHGSLEALNEWHGQRVTA